MKVNKSKLFKIAHAILRKGEAENFSQALKSAWKAIKVYSRMLVGSVEFTFKKVIGLCDVHSRVMKMFDIISEKIDNMNEKDHIVLWRY